MNSEACSAPDESKIMVPKLVEPSGESVASGQVTPKLDMRNGIPHITVPVINMISVPNSSTATANASHSIHSHVHGGQLPLSATTSLSNNVGASRTTPTTRTERQSKKSIEPRSTPKRGNFNKVNRKGKSHQLVSKLNRPCEHHSFLTEITDVQQMEQGLVQLLDDFHSGKLQAFGKDCSFEKMDNVREQQERLARLHFDLGSQQDPYGTLSDEGGALAKDHLMKLVYQLQELSLAIEQLQSSTSGNSLQTEV